MVTLDDIVAGRTELVVQFIEEGNSARSADAYGVTLLRWCAHYGDIPAINFLLDQGLSLDELGENYDLNGAVYHGHPALTEMLLANGADANFPLPDTGETPLHSVLTKMHRPECAPIVGLLLQHGADPNAKTIPGVETYAFMRDIRTRGETPLHRAAAYADLVTIRLLLEAGALRETKDVNGDSPLTWASWHLRPRDILAELCYGPYHVRA